MLRLTKLADYGVLLMSCMAASSRRVYAAAELSEMTRIPLPTVSKLLPMLQHEGLLESMRGVRGGYRLGRDASEISVRDIITVFEGQLALTECSMAEAHCDQHRVCSISRPWQYINAAMADVLADISLSDMADPGFRPRFHLQRSLPIEVCHV